MKKLAILLLFFAFGSLYAQKGTYYLGGAAGFNSASLKARGNDNFTTTSWTFSPEVGTWLTNKIQTGVALNIGNQKNDFQSINSIGGTLYARNWFKAGQSFRPFLGLNVGYNTGKITFQNNNNDNSENTFGLNLNGGFGYSFSPKWAVIGSFGFVGFETTKSEDSVNGEIRINNFGLDVNTLGNRFNIGFYYTL